MTTHTPRRTLCTGTAQPVVTLANHYPACSVCGREFSSQGRKSQHCGRNYWQTGAPRHFQERIHA